MKFQPGVLAIVIPMLFTGTVYANDPFSELDNEVQQLSADHTEEFNIWYAEHIKSFNEWQMAYLDEWDEQKRASIKKWGDSKTPSPQTIVMYDAKNDSRTVIDLDKGEITINYAIPEPANSDQQPQDELAVINDVIQKNEQLWQDVGLSEPPQTATQQDVAIKEVALNQDVLEQIKQDIKSQTERQMSQLDIFVEQDEQLAVAEQKEKLLVEQKQALKANENERLASIENDFSQAKAVFKKTSSQVVEYKAKIPSSAVSERAQNYLPYVYAESEKRNLPAPLVLAIMHTESHFNPKAKSYVPAYGLMQIVPTTAGHDVNKLYRGKDKPMKEGELYNPKINVETGTAYLKILESRYLRGIDDPQSAIYSVIAAYNTGSGNVAKAFGERSVRAAVKKINQMSAEQVYRQLISNLPYEETRNYLKKVNKRMQSYQQQQTYSMI